MIKYEIKNRTIELTYDTGKEFMIIKKFLDIIDLINEVRK